MQTVESSSSRRASSAERHALVLGYRLCIAGLAYYVAGRLGLLIPYVGSHVSLVWLPSGIALAAYLRWGGAMVPAVLAAAFLVNFRVDGPAWMAAAIAFGNAAGPWVSARLLRRWAFDAKFTRRRDLGVYLLAVALGMTITACNGTAWLRIAGFLPSTEWAAAWLTWWAGDSVGALVGGIPLVAATWPAVLETFAGRRGASNLALLGLVLVCAVLAFSPETPLSPAIVFPLMSVPLFVMAVLALRAGVLAASLAVLLLSACAAWGTARGVGPFAGHDRHAGQLALWSYLAAQVCTSVLICGLAAELLAAQRQRNALRDAAQRREALARVAASEERLRAITDNAPALIAELDAQTRFCFANRTYRDWMGLEPETLLGRTMAEVLGAETMAAIRPQVDAALRGEAATYERVIDAGLGVRHIQASLVPRRDADGAVGGFYVVASDITPRREAEEGLRRSEMRLRSITDHLPMRVSYVDAEERYRFLNLAYERAFGQPRDTYYGRTVREVLGDGAYAEAAPRIRRALSGEAVTFESEITTREGYRCYRASYVPQRADDGKTVLGFVAIITDTTAQKLEERRLIELSQLDSLTGLLNRAGFERERQEAIARSRATGRLMALMMVDIDGFKQVNDSHGHLSGDMLLQGFAGRLSKALRPDDSIARPGGDEFAVLVEDLERAEDAATIAQHIVDAMGAPFVLEAVSIHITTSIGVALYRGNAGVTARELTRLSDELLYAAKAAGKNRYCVGTAGG